MSDRLQPVSHPASSERAERIAAVGYDYAAHAVEPVEACNLCGSSELKTLAEQDRYGYPATFQMCVRCGLGFLSPRLTAREYGAFYESVYRPLVSAYHGRRIDAETVQTDQRAYAEDLVVFLRENQPRSPATVLDVGGSTGIVAAAVRDSLGAEVTVLDPAPDELAVAAAAGMETVAGFAEDYDPGDRRWDLVLLCQTIDHLLDVRSTLTSLRRLTAEGGHAFVDVLDLMIAARKQGSIAGAVKIDHPYYLTRETALAFFQQAGFEPVAERLSADGHWGFVLAAGDPAEPDWGKLHEVAEAHRAELEGLS
jgi:2-polyprenyl-3-methyl-5-hydroxy-6-metoxy-1,4-benzoquinol methylase